jgi:hypothetical protein
MKIKKAVWCRNVKTKALLFHFGKCLTFVLIMMMPERAQAQLELYGKFNTDGSVEPIINYYGSKKISPKFAVTFFGLVRQTWSQALIGASYMPTPDISLSASAGIEHGQHLPRYSASIWVKRGPNTFLLLGELGHGYQNYLYKVNMFRQFSEKVSVGIMDWRYHGLGPNLRYTITKIESTIWIMPAYDHEQQVARCMVGYSLRM